MEEFKALRVEIDKNIKHVETTIALRARELPGGRELALVRTKLQEAKMWVGKAMEVNDSPLPEEFRDEYKQN